jgi:metal-responsive CopG/Arc/MetJ family transcriptional regulator
LLYLTYEISIPESIFRAADGFAKEQGISRSEVFTTAMRQFLARQNRTALLENLNSVYGSTDSDSLDAQARASLLALEWQD